MRPRSGSGSRSLSCLPRSAHACPGQFAFAPASSPFAPVRSRSAPSSAHASGLASTLAFATAYEPGAGPGGTPGSDQARRPRQQRSLGSERGLATPSPDGKGEISLGPSVTIMPVDSYSTLGRSCEPAFKWIPDPGQARIRARAARQRQTLAGGWSALGGHEVSCSFTWPGSSPRSSRPDPGPDPADWRPRPKGTGAPRSAELGIRRCLPALIRSA